MGVRVRFREVAAYGRLSREKKKKKTAGTGVWCPVLEGVRLREVSVRRGSTV